MPKSLSNEHRAGIVDHLRNNKKYALSIAFTDGDVNAAKYARDLAAAFAKGGWVVSGAFPVACGSSVGLHVEVNDLGGSQPRCPALDGRSSRCWGDPGDKYWV